MPFEIENLPEAIRQVKKDLRRALPNYAEVFRDVESEIRRKVAQIVKEPISAAFWRLPPT